jgi:tetratricopeptide (TPR) repeat protein
MNRWVGVWLLVVHTTATGQQKDSSLILLTSAAEQARDGRAESQRRAVTMLLEAADRAKRSGKRGIEAYALMNAAQVYNNLGQPALARPLAARGLDRFPRGAKGSSDLILLMVLGETLQYLGDPDAALQHYRRAVPDPRGATSREQGRVLNDMGSAFHQLGLLDSAGWYLEQALRLRESFRDTLGLGTTLNNLGTVQETLGRPDSASALFAVAIPLRQAAGDLAGLGATLNNLGYSFDLLHRPADALKVYQRALDALSRAGNVSIAGLTWINMGRAHFELGNLDTARIYVLKGLDIKRSVGDSIGVTWGLVDLGRIERASGNPVAAHRAFDDARRLLHQTGDRAREGIVLYQLGSLARDPSAGGNAVEALARFDQAAALRSLVGASSDADQDRISFAEQDLALFEEWTLAWLDRSDLPAEDAALAALAASERGRARALLALMRQNREAITAGRDLVREGRATVDALRRGKTPALVYMVGADTTIVWTIPLLGAVTAHRIPIARAAVTAAVERFRRALGVESSCKPTDSPAPTLRDAGDSLTAILFGGDILSAVPDSGRLLIVPHGALNLVPFAALTRGAGGDTLGMSLALSYAPSVASAVEATSRRSVLPQSGTDRWKALRPALVIGNPTMPLLPVCGVVIRPRALLAADSASRRLAVRLQSDALTGDRATESAVRAAAPDARLIDLETHGFAYENEAQGRESFVALAPDTSRSAQPGDDGRLTVGEILDRFPRLRAELVILGACQTGLGTLRNAEGVVGLQRAFLARGARSTLVSLWDVDDRATAAMIERFYVHWLDKGLGKAEALQSAQKDARDSGFGNPRFWAGFVLAGGN